MTWLEATHERTIEVEAELDAIADFFADPNRLRHCMVALDRGEKIDEKTWRWLMTEVGARNITFQGDYTVTYERDGDVVTWKSHEGKGNMKTDGKATFKDLGGGRTAVTYRETIASDLPIPRLAAKVFKPIAAREVRKGIDLLLDAVEEYVADGKLTADGDS